MSSFSGLQADLKAGRTDRMVFYAFDLLYLDGYDLTKVPLIERKTRWPGLLDDAPADGVVRMSAHLEGDGEAMFRHACRLGLEGHRLEAQGQALYRGPRPALAEDQVQRQREEFVIAGYVPSTTSTKGRRLARHGRQRRRPVRPCRPGRQRLHRSSWHGLCGRARTVKRRAQPPFAARWPTEAARGVRWVEPKLVAEVEHRGLDGRRAAASLVLQGLARRQGSRRR